MSQDRTASAHHVTVVLPTHRRPAALARALGGLARQRDPGVPWDVIVVDNDLPPGTAHTMGDRLARFPVPVRTVVEPVLGASNARNRGIAEASGTIVAFIDDDVVPDDDWLARLVGPVLDERCEAVGGKVELDPAVPRPRWLAPWLLPYLADFQPADDEIDVRDLPTGVLSEPYVLTASAAFTHEILHLAGGLDPLLGPRRGVPSVNDDLDLCRKVMLAGGRIRYVPGARVVHELPPHRLQRRYVARRLYAQGRSDWMLDRAFWAGTTTGGVRGATLDFLVQLARRAWRDELLVPRRTFLWCEVVRDLGLLREALAYLARGRRLPTALPGDSGRPPGA